MEIHSVKHLSGKGRRWLLEWKVNIYGKLKLLLSSKVFNVSEKMTR